jgi:HSP20 family molecular chaperone IbpA
MTLAGFDAKEVEVTASPSEIIVHAQTKSEKKTEESNVTSTEFPPPATHAIHLWRRPP